MEVARIPLAEIVPSDRARPVDVARVGLLAESIKALGLRTPITVRSKTRLVGGRPTPGYAIVTGHHRAEAARRLGWQDIAAHLMEAEPDDIELWEIDENFARAELTDAQRADHHVRREEILKRKGLVSKGRGGDQSEKSSLRSYAKQAGETLGVSKRTVEKDLARGKKINPDILAEVTGTDLDKGVVLDELAKTPREDQPARLEEMRRARSTVRPAPDPLNAPEAHERQLAALMAAWNRAARPVREEFLARIDTPVFDRRSP